ncbi:Auxin efflux carrier component [Rhynchospora pubera]|uniref:Auxin efflux carrier component n=1 Tax=Rhynchospora pubera TaxID=906938 RepID=A0AAV8G1E9_9POAL|nr:Auxin efflux carrier component [Rhynchospora pubera]
MVPLYFALSLGYGSIKWWNILTPANHGAINRTVSRIALPLFAFKFTLNTDPYKWNYRVIAGDIIAKVLILGSLAAWTKYSSNGRYAWAITSYSLTSLTNALVMEVPLLNAMYGNWAGDLVVQLAIFQAVAWLTLLLFVLELKKALEEMIEDSFSILSLMKVVGRKLARNPNSYASLIGITWALVVNRYT